MKRLRFCYFAPHPVQYHVGIYRKLQKSRRLEIKVYYGDRLGLEPTYVDELKTTIEWDIDLLGGYEKSFLVNYSLNNDGGFLSRINFGIFRVFFKERPDVVMFNGYAVLSDWFVLLAAKLYRSKVIWRGEAVLRGNETDRALKQTVKRWVLPKFFKACDAVMYSCGRNRDYLRYYGVPEEKLFPVPCAVDNDFFRDARKGWSGKTTDTRRELEIDDEDLVIVFCARFTTRKRPMDLLRAVRTIPNSAITVLLVGDGPERSRLEEYARKNDIKAKFVGFKNQSELPKYYSIADVGVVISDYDPSPKAMNEIMNFAVPMIVTDCVGTAGDLVRHGENGFIVEVGDIEAISRAIDYLNSNRDQLKKMGDVSAAVVGDWTFDKDVFFIEQAIDYVMEQG
jgi:glycosyltransferase involved in cell wall biosynthesis